jgi:hypothetical protein
LCKQFSLYFIQIGVGASTVYREANHSVSGASCKNKMFSGFCHGIFEAVS